MADGSGLDAGIGALGAIGGSVVGGLIGNKKKPAFYDERRRWGKTKSDLGFAMGLQQLMNINPELAYNTMMSGGGKDNAKKFVELFGQPYFNTSDYDIGNDIFSKNKQGLAQGQQGMRYKGRNVNEAEDLAVIDSMNAMFRPQASVGNTYGYNRAPSQLPLDYSVPNISRGPVRFGYGGGNFGNVGKGYGGYLK